MDEITQAARAWAKDNHLLWPERGSLDAYVAGYTAGLERAAKEADKERDCAATDLHDAKKDLGSMYDPNCYGTGYDAGRRQAAITIAESVRTLAHPPKEGRET